MVGFVQLLTQLFIKERLAVSLTYLASLLLTLYFSMFAQSTPLTVLFSVIQIIALLFLICGIVPGGMTGMKFLGSLCKRSVGNSLPI